MSIVNVRKMALMGVLVVLLSFMAGAINPLVAFADSKSTGGGSEPFDDMQITIGTNGQLEVGGTSFKSERSEAWNGIIIKYKSFIAGISGICTVTMVALFIFSFMKLASSAGNPQARQQALVGILWTGVSATLLGAVTVIVGFFYRAI